MEDIKTMLEAVSGDVSDTVRAADPAEIRLLVEAMRTSRRVYAVGAGRSLHVVSAFGQRLYQCGLPVNVWGDAVLPPAGREDLMIACSSSGETPTTLCLANRGKEAGCGLAAVTASGDSSLAKLADFRLMIPQHPSPERPLPLGTMFEQAALIVLDCAAALLAEALGISPRALEKRHGNIE